ncbi:hypothetical protein [Paenibacillus sp. sgz500958]|uniref:hypothetical protein n=1 Tax=Paenibacillus sp. sgz500958 TaxID=3242475 RepID=UPI0036D244DE
MKRFSIIATSLMILLGLLLVLVKSEKEIVSVTLVSETTEFTYTDPESIQIFEEAISHVKKLRGAVDVGPPTYRMKVTYADSERMLHIRGKYAEKLADLLSISS